MESTSAIHHGAGPLQEHEATQVLDLLLPHQVERVVEGEGLRELLQLTHGRHDGRPVGSLGEGKDHPKLPSIFRTQREVTGEESCILLMEAEDVEDLADVEPHLLHKVSVSCTVNHQLPLAYHI